MKNIRKLWQYSYHYKHCFLLLLLFVCLAAYAEIRIPQFMSDVLDDILASKPLSSIAQSCIVMGVFAVLLALEGVGEGYFVSRWAAGVTRNLSDKLFSRILSFESKDMDHFGSATFLTRLTTDITLLRRALEMVCNLLLCPLLIIFSVISAIQINHGLSLIFLLIIPILAGILLFIILRSRVFYRRMLINYDEMNQTLSESFRGMRTVKSYAREDRQQSVFRKIADHLRQNSVSAEKLAALNNPFSKMAVNLSVLALAWFGGFQVVQQDVTVGDLFCLISYANQILAQVLIISMILVPLITSMVSFSRILEVLEWDSGVQTQEHSEADCAPEDDHVAVSLKHVCFSYRKDNPGNPLLNDTEKPWTGFIPELFHSSVRKNR